ncbi:lytic murein transglycosylase B [Porticoccus sp.]|uniref:lytic murein transglycosylase B n=1 Tax=Porticoccus sp. TaxID=2024853 RepID=UPI0025CE9C3B|nr:lytic murein transglycosylase B [Porticoccus sp.]
MNILFSVALGMLLSLSVQASYLQHPDARAFAERMVSEHGFERNVLDSLLDAAEKKQAIIDAMERPAEKVKPWKDYRKIFITEKRIAEGVDFWRKNRAVLSEASRQYQVAPEVIVAIIGVETFYGRIKGSFRVIDALATLSFDYPPRSPFFTKQLEQFLLLAREQDQDPLKLMGSYAGAMGYGQFIPSSYRSFAVDFDGDGFADIWENKADAIGSVANYFAEHGWKMGETVVVPAGIKESFDETLLNQSGLDKTVDELAKMGFSSHLPLNGDAKAIPVRLDGDNGLEYWLGLNNFYVITRYNRSLLYAMAVHELSQQILERVGEDTL